MGILNWFRGGNVLYYPGCLSKYVLKPEVENYKKILDKIGIDFLMIPGELCCGSPVLNAGYETEACKLARKNLELFKKHNIKKIITNCPACYRMFSKYKEMMPDWNIEVEHITSSILNFLKKKKVEYIFRERVTYHDPCHLGRHSGIYEPPREILRRLGYEVVEMKNNRENALCCGGGAGLRTNNPSLAGKIAQARVKQASEIGVSKIITTCPLCFAHVSEAAASLSTPKSNTDTQGLRGMAENSGVEIIEFSQVVASGLGLKVEKSDIQKDKKELKEAVS